MNISSLFTVDKLTEAINLIPPLPSKLGSLGLFSEKFLTTRTVLLEYKNQQFSLLTSRPVGAPPQYMTQDHRNIRALVIPHIPVADVILPEDIQGVRAFGGDELAGAAAVISERLEKIRKRFDLTLEWMRVGAIKGIILDGDGNTLLNLFTEFDISQQIVDFALDNTSTEVLAKCHVAKRIIEQNAMGQLVTGFRAYCSPSFFDYLVTHPSVKEAYKGYAMAQSMLAGDNRKGFTFGGITFEEYNATVVKSDGTTVQLIESNTAYLFPEGTDFFTVYYAPGNFNETVNTVAQPIYVKSAEREFGRGYDIYAESNPLPICKNPSVLVKLTI